MAKKDMMKTLNEIVQPIADSMNVELVDLEFIKEAGNWYLRVYIDKEGGVFINDCEEVSHAISDELDEKDPIEQSYILEVSSPGLDRPLKKQKDFDRNKGQTVEVKLFKPINGEKLFEGILVGLIDNKVLIESENHEKLEFSMEDVALVKLAVKF